MKMDNSNGGFINLMISLSGTVFAWITKDVQGVATLMATLVSITTGILASIYYYKRIKHEK